MTFTNQFKLKALRKRQCWYHQHPEFEPCTPIAVDIGDMPFDGLLTICYTHRKNKALLRRQKHPTMVQAGVISLLSHLGEGEFPPVLPWSNYPMTFLVWEHRFMCCHIWIPQFIIELIHVCSNYSYLLYECRLLMSNCPNFNFIARRTQALK